MFLQQAQVRKKTDALLAKVLGDPRHLAPFYPPGLTEQVLGVHARESVGLSRLYKWRTPPVAIDFEPSPLDGLFYCDQKRRWCHAHGIAYVPVFLRERLTEEQVSDRVALELQMLASALQAQAEDAVLQTTAPEAEEDEFARLVDQETLARMDIAVRVIGRKLTGPARQKQMAAIRSGVEQEFRKARLHGSLGYHVRYSKSPLVAR